MQAPPAVMRQYAVLSRMQAFPGLHSIGMSSRLRHCDVAQSYFAEKAQLRCVHVALV